MAGHEMVEFIEEGHEFAIAGDEILQAAAFEMCPHRTSQQDVTAEEYAVSPIEKAYVIWRFAGCMDDLELPTAKIDPVPFLQPMIDLEGRKRKRFGSKPRGQGLITRLSAKISASSVWCDTPLSAT